MSEIKFFALGGAGEIGKNMFGIESKESIFIFDAGVKNPESLKFGVELITVDPTYLKDNKQKVKAIIISHGHDDQMLGLLSILPSLKNVPVYVNGIAKMILQENLKKEKMNYVKVVEYKAGNKLVIADLTLESVSVCHSLIDNSILFGKIDNFTFCYATDFIFSIDKSKHFTTDIRSLEKLALDYKVDLLFVSSLGASIKTQVSPAHKIESYIKDDISLHKGRVFITQYEQNTLFTRDIFDAINGSGKKVIIVGEMFKKIVKYLIDNQVINTKGIIFGKEEDIDKETNAVILIGEAGPKLFDKIIAIGRGEEDFKLKKEDLFINTAAAFDGSEVKALGSSGEIIKGGAKFKALPFKQIIPAHASIEEIKQLINIVRPKYIIPVKGDHKQFHFFKQGISQIFPNKKIIFGSNGDAFNFVNKEFKNKSKVSTSSLLIQKTGKDAINFSVLNDRERMASNGLVLIGVSMNTKKEQVGTIDVQIRGISLIDLNATTEAIKNIINKDIVDRRKEDITKIRTGIRNKVQRMIMKETYKKPTVLTVISTLRR